MAMNLPLARFTTTHAYAVGICVDVVHSCSSLREVRRFTKRDHLTAAYEHHEPARDWGTKNLRDGESHPPWFGTTEEIALLATSLSLQIGSTDR
jgi:hypothetical protein